MFRCLDTGLDNSHQCLKKNRKVVGIADNKISILLESGDPKSAIIVAAPLKLMGGCLLA